MPQPFTPGAKQAVEPARPSPHQLQRPPEQRIEIVRLRRRARLRHRRLRRRPVRAEIHQRRDDVFFRRAESCSSARTPPRAPERPADPACRAAPAPSAPPFSCRPPGMRTSCSIDPDRIADDQIRRRQSAQRRDRQLRSDPADRDQFLEQAPCPPAERNPNSSSASSRTCVWMCKPHRLAFFRQRRERRNRNGDLVADALARRR